MLAERRSVARSNSSNYVWAEAEASTKPIYISVKSVSYSAIALFEYIIAS